MKPIRIRSSDYTDNKGKSLCCGGHVKKNGDCNKCKQSIKSK